MKSLFLRVFLWFWLSTALVVVALFVATEITKRDRDANWRGMMDDPLAFYGRIGVEILEREGRAELLKFLEDVERNSHVRAHIFDERGAEVTGRPLPAPELQALAARALETNAIQRMFAPGDGVLVAVPGTTGGNRRYAVAANVRPNLSRPPTDGTLSLLLRLAAALLTAGVLCYWLTRYIVSPVIKLRAVTKQVAGGDLSARVSPALGKRRDELAALGHDFDVMAARIEALMNAQQRLLRDISHELRSPLARLGVSLDLARLRAGAEAAGALDRIEREAQRLNEMIGQLLALSRWESDEHEIRREGVDLVPLVREIVADADFEAHGKQRVVRLSVADAQSYIVLGSRELLRSAVENVVRNAVRHTAEDTAVEVTLQVREEVGGAMAVVSVRDAGAGVPAETIDDIFQPFYRVEDARDRVSGGTGLGLAITKRAVELHGGTIGAANLREGGFLVEIMLPLSPTASAG